MSPVMLRLSSEGDPLEPLDLPLMGRLRCAFCGGVPAAKAPPNSRCRLLTAATALSGLSPLLLLLLLLGEPSSPADGLWACHSLTGAAASPVWRQELPTGFAALPPSSASAHCTLQQGGTSIKSSHILGHR